MACVQIIEKGVVIGHMCGQDGDDIRLDQCYECGSNWPEAEFLCDFPVGQDKTCDRVLCKACSKLVGRDMHYCPTHYVEYREYKKSSAGRKEILKAVRDGKILTAVK